MNDETKKTIHEDEYQYPDEEYVTESTPSEEDVAQEEIRSGNKFDGLRHFLARNKRPAIVIFAVIALFLGMKIVSHINKNKKMMTAQPQQKAVKQVAQKPSNSQVQQQQSAVLVNGISGLQQAAQNNSAAITQMQGQVQGFKNTMDQVQSSTSTLNQTMVVLIKQMKQLNTKLEQLKAAQLAKPPVVSKKKAAGPVPPVLTFNLRAVIPGRAWVESNNGLTESVTIGDSIPQYGTVKAIKPGLGEVDTSSGKVIRYGKNDY